MLLEMTHIYQIERLLLHLECNKIFVPIQPISKSLFFNFGSLILVNFSLIFFQVALLCAAVAAAHASVLLGPAISTGISSGARTQDVSILFAIYNRKALSRW